MAFHTGTACYAVQAGIECFRSSNHQLLHLLIVKAILPELLWHCRLLQCGGLCCVPRVSGCVPYPLVCIVYCGMCAVCGHLCMCTVHGPVCGCATLSQCVLGIDGCMFLLCKALSVGFDNGPCLANCHSVVSQSPAAV